jgi:GNAT superfamily N-acetyltransferase
VLTTADDEQFPVAERIEYEVFLDAGYCEESPDGRALEYEPWRHISRYWVVLNAENDIRGVVRVIHGNYENLPVSVFERDTTFPEDPLLEMASLAVLPDERSTGVAQELYRGAFMDAVRSGMRGVVGIGELWTLKLFTDLGLPFRQLGPSRWFMGGNCIPIGASIKEILDGLPENPNIMEWGLQEIDLRETDDAGAPATSAALSIGSDEASHPADGQS